MTTCTPPSLGAALTFAALFGSVLAGFMAMGFVDGFDKWSPLARGAIGVIVGFTLTLLIVLGVYVGYEHDYNRCEQRTRVTVTHPKGTK